MYQNSRPARITRSKHGSGAIEYHELEHRGSLLEKSNYSRRHGFPNKSLRMKPSARKNGTTLKQSSIPTAQILMKKRHVPDTGAKPGPIVQLQKLKRRITISRSRILSVLVWMSSSHRTAFYKKVLPIRLYKLKKKMHECTSTEESKVKDFIKLIEIVLLRHYFNGEKHTDSCIS